MGLLKLFYVNKNKDPSLMRQDRGTFYSSVATEFRAGALNSRVVMVGKFCVEGGGVHNKLFLNGI